MVALVRESIRAPVRAIHRTFLTTDGHKHPAVESVKRMLGPCGGGALWPDSFESVLALAEGIETALSLAHITAIPTVAALSAGNLAAVPIPNRIIEVVIGADIDASGAGMLAAREAMWMHWRPWRRVRIVRPTHGHDFNDSAEAA
jgi:putative DNA primase/helicase